MRLVELAQWHLHPCLHAGACVLDATAGNGHDSLFLAQAVGLKGTVYAFDVQEQAEQQTRALLRTHGLESCLQFFHCNHALLANFIPKGISAAMFNLGYLPGAKHDLITTPEDSLEALRAVLPRLATGGRLSLMAYPGHEGGKEEFTQISDELFSLPQSQFNVFLTRCHNAASSAPTLFTAIKKT